MSRLSIVLVLALPTTIAPLTQLAGDGRVEYQAKATYLYQFSRFVEWPGAAGSGPLKVCIAERDVFEGLLHDALRGASVDGRPIQTHLISAPDRGCHILFVPAQTAESEYLRAVQDNPTLTVGEATGFLQQGGIIRLFAEQREVRFEVNLDAADRAGLRLSSRLLQLSRATTGGGRRE